MRKDIEKLLRFIDLSSEWSGKAVAFLLIILITITAFDTILRYLFNAPTIWAFDLSCMIFGPYFMIGAAWVLKNNEHVKIDFIYRKMSRRDQVILDIFFDLVIFFPFVILSIIYSIKYAALSWSIMEKSWQSVWYPPLYPFKTAIPLAFLLLLLQGIAEFIRNIFVITNGGGNGK